MKRSVSVGVDFSNGTVTICAITNDTNEFVYTTKENIPEEKAFAAICEINKEYSVAGVLVDGEPTQKHAWLPPKQITTTKP